MTIVEFCARCGAELRWLHGTWQCPHCKLKLGCCEGEPPEAADAAAPLRLERRPARRSIGSG